MHVNRKLVQCTFNERLSLLTYKLKFFSNIKVVARNAFNAFARKAESVFEVFAERNTFKTFKTLL